MTAASGGGWADVFALVAELDTRSYYGILEVAEDAGEAEVRAAFGRLTAAFHPDRRGRGEGAEEVRALVSIQARVNEAYRVLSHPRRRAEYDRGLAAGALRLGGRGAPPPAVEDPSSPNARRFFQLGAERERSRDLAGAVMQYRMALQIEPASAAIRAALTRLGAPPPPLPGPTAKPVAAEPEAPAGETKSKSESKSESGAWADDLFDEID